MSKHIKRVDLRKELAKRVNLKGMPVCDTKMRATTQQNNQNNQPLEGAW